MICTMDELRAKARAATKQVIVVAAAEDRHILEAVHAALTEEFTQFILVGDKEKIRQISALHSIPLKEIPIIDVKEPHKAAEKAVQLIREQKADILMKGMIPSAALLKAVLDKEKGLRRGNFLSMAAIFQLPAYHKLLVLTDPAVNLVQDLQHKAEMLKSGIEVCQALGIERPKAAALCAIEKVNQAMKATVDAELLREMVEREEIQNCLFEGPHSMDTAISKRAAEQKGLKSEIAGDVDILLTPNIEAGNVLYKTFIHLAQARVAGIVVGARVPIILTSRSDTADAKMNSIALALILSHEKSLERGK